jgi:hypothetical protein
MGQCLTAHADPLIGTNILLGKTKREAARGEEAAGAPKHSHSNSKNKLSLFISNHHHVGNNIYVNPLSPSERTQPETPASSSVITPGSKNQASKSLSSMITPFSTTRSYLTRNAYSSPSKTICADENNKDYAYSPSALLPSPSIFLDGLENIQIPEEVDPDAPSDEEESYQRFVEETQEKQGISKWEMEPGPIRTSRKQKQPLSPPLKPLVAVKTRNKHVTKPTSIVRHHPFISPPPGTAVTVPPLSAPGAVDRQTLAEFNKLKIQVQLQQHATKQSKRLQKLEDRFQDVQKYRQLVKEFEEIQDTLSVNSQLSQRDGLRLKRSDSFDLRDTGSWYFDFHAVDTAVDYSDLDDDDQSLASQFSQQSHLSLLSASSMDSQRKYFAAKKHTKTTVEKIDKLEKLLKEMNERKKKKLNGEMDAAPRDGNNEENSRGDYGPPTRRDSFSSRMSVKSDHGQVTRNAKSDYGPAPGRKESLPTQIVTSPDYGPSLRRGSFTSQLSMTSEYGPRSVQTSSQNQANDDQEDEISLYDSSGSLGSDGSSIRRTRMAPVFDESKIVVATDDIGATPKRSGQSSNDQSSMIIGLIGKTVQTPSKREHVVATSPSTSQATNLKASSPQSRVDYAIPQHSERSPISNRLTRPLDDEKFNDNQQDSARLPRWRTFLNQSPSLRKKPESSPENKKKFSAQNGCIFSMSTEEFLQIAEDQFEDHQVVSISKLENEDDEDAIGAAARKLVFGDEELDLNDTAKSPDEEATVIITSDEEEQCTEIGKDVR